MSTSISNLYSALEGWIRNRGAVFAPRLWLVPRPTLVFGLIPLLLWMFLATQPLNAQSGAASDSPLGDYPRPSNDNGWGVHWSPTLMTQPNGVVDRYLAEVDRMDLHWLKLMQPDQSTLEHQYLLVQLAHRDIEPVLRVYKTYNDPYTDLERLVQAGVQAGVHYYELYADPNVAGLAGGWRPGQAIDVARLAGQWSMAAETVRAAGGYPGLPSLAPNGALEDVTFLRQFLAELKSQGQLDQLDHAWLPVQNYTGNLPLDDANGFRKFEIYHQILLESAGLSLPIISTEGGTIVDDREDARYPPVTQQTVAEQTVRAFRYMQHQAPDYYFAFMPWLLVNAAAGGYNGAWERHAWFPVDGAPRPVVAAVRKLAQDSNSPSSQPVQPLPQPNDDGRDLQYAGKDEHSENENVDGPNEQRVVAASAEGPDETASAGTVSAAALSSEATPSDMGSISAETSSQESESSPFSHGDVSLSESSITLPTYGYEEALVETTRNDPIWPAPRLDPDRVGPPTAHSYRTLVLENDFVRLTILPELGGRIYRWEDKIAGRDILYHNSVVKPTQWGVQGWWLAVGGMEWDFPLPDHGLHGYQPWQVEKIAESRSAAVRLTRAARDGLTVQVTVSLSADRRFFAVTTELGNEGAEPLEIHFWANAMLAPGSGNSIAPGTRLVWPADAFIVHGSAGSRALAMGAEVDWPAGSGVDVSQLDNWPTQLSFFATPAAQRSAAGLVDPNGDLAVVRSFPHRLVPGVKAFYGPGLDPTLWTDGNSNHYFELWGGPSINFATPLRLAPHQNLHWTEQWYTVPGLGEFVAANANAALALHSTGEDTELRLAVTGSQIAADGARSTVRVGDELVFSEPLDLTVDDLYRHTIHRRLGSGHWLVQLFDRYGRVLLAYDSEPPAQPGQENTAADPIEWDERLDDLEVSVVPAQVEPGQTYWKVIKAEFQDPHEGGGRHHIFVEVLDENGERIIGQQIKIGWPDGSAIITSEDKPAPEYAANFPMYGDLGGYTAQIPGRSDKVTGMGLPFGRMHVVYRIIFQRTVEK